MSTETVTVVALNPESSRDGRHHWWILVGDDGRKLKVWDRPVADAVRTLALQGPVLVDVEPSGDPKFFDKVTAARPANGAAQAHHASPPDVAYASASPASSESMDGILADFMHDLSSAALRAEARLRDLGVPF